MKHLKKQGLKLFLVIGLVTSGIGWADDPDFELPENTPDFPTEGGNYDIDDSGTTIPGAGGGILDDLEGVYDTGKGFVEGGIDIYNDYASIFGLGQELVGLINDFSISGLADFACNTGREIDARSTVPDPNDPNNQTNDPNVQGPPSPNIPAGPSDETGTACEIATGINKLETTFSDANKSIFSKADTIFGDLASAGYFGISSGDHEEVSKLLTSFEGLLNEVDTGPLVDVNGDPIGRIEALYKRGKAVVDAGKEVATKDAAAKNPFNPGAVADNVYSIEERAKLQEYGIKSKVTQAASEDLSDASLQFTGETEQLNEAFNKQSDKNQVNQSVSVSTRATMKPLIDTLNDTMRANGMAQIEMHKQFNVLSEQGVYTVSQLSILAESTLRQERTKLEKQTAEENLEQRKSERGVEQLEQYTNGIAGVFEIAADPSLSTQ